MRRLIIFVGVLLLFVCAACSSTGATSSDGDAARGAVLFKQNNNGAPACTTCHTLDGSTLVGPSLKGFSAVASTRVQGMSAADYARNSIEKPSSYVVSG